VDLNTKGRNVFLLELSGQMTLDESGLSELQSAYVLRNEPMRQTAKRSDASSEPGSVDMASSKHTFPVPPSPTSTSLKVGTSAAIIVVL
jgi:hypothetical protein